MITMKLNVPQCRHLIQNLDSVGYLPLSAWKDLDTVVETIQKSDTYRWLWDEVKAYAEEVMKELKEKNEPLDKEANELYEQLKTVEGKGAKKEKKKISTRLQELATQWDLNMKYAQQKLLDFQDHKLDLDSREIYIVDVDDAFYQILDTKFHIDDKKFNPEDKTSWFVERVNTEWLEWEVIIQDSTVAKNEISDEENAG